jgi:hypothetical protein
MDLSLPPSRASPKRVFFLQSWHRSARPSVDQEGSRRVRKNAKKQLTGLQGPVEAKVHGQPVQHKSRKGPPCHTQLGEDTNGKSTLIKAGWHITGELRPHTRFTLPDRPLTSDPRLERLRAFPTDERTSTTERGMATSDENNYSALRNYSIEIKVSWLSPNSITISGIP